MVLEKKLIWDARKGNSKAIAKLFELNFDKLFRFMSQFSKDRDLVEDWVQVSFIKAFNNIGNFKGNCRFSTWLFSIAMNEMKTYFGSAYNRYVSLPDDSTPEPEYHDSSFTWNYDMKIILNDLAEESKAIFILYEVEGYSHKEIAQIMEISESASRTKLSRTKKLLQKKWAEYEA